MFKFDIVAFLEQYERFPCLWQKKGADFKNRAKRDNAEQMLLPISGLPSIKMLRKKIRSIRCTYNQEVAKIKKSIGSGLGTSDVYRPKLIWFNTADRFLRQNEEDIKIESNLTLIKETVENEEKFDKPNIINLKPLPSSITPSLQVKRPQASRKRSGSGSFHRVKRKRKVDNAVEVLKQAAIRPHSIPIDFTSFGQHIAAQMTCLPLEEAIKLQEDIQKLITTARLKNLNVQNLDTTSDSEHSVSIHSPDFIVSNIIGSYTPDIICTPDL